MLKLYNQEMIDLENNEEEPILEFSCNVDFYVKDKFKISGGCGLNQEHLSYIDHYEQNNNELIIYEYAALYQHKSWNLLDYFTKKEFDIGAFCGNTTFDEMISFANQYFKEHKNEFTKYKHTFKKNDTGYYWYSTEVV